MASPGLSPGITSATRDRNGLCLLSLDGGGVRGLSTLLILKGIMQQINSTRQRESLSHVKPCDVFDLIGGTSTGGLIAIMLGRLQMDIQECIDAYSELSRRVFSKKGLPVDLRGHIQGRYKASVLESAIKDIIKASNLPVDEPLNDRKDRGCRTFVCAVRKENKAVAHLRAYYSDRTLVEDRALIWEAARATSAASGFFDPISIGKHGQEYVDAGLGCNNPVQEVWTEAQDIWSPGEGDLATLVKCFISIGTGNPGTSPIEDSAFKMLTKTLGVIATETEKTAETFVKSHRDLYSQKRYFRFNVDQGLQSVGLEEYKKENEIVSATTLYMESQHMALQVQSCSQAMKIKEFWKGDHTEMRRRILSECQFVPEQFQLPFSLTTAPVIDYFVGRRDDLSSIESILLPVNPTAQKIVVLHGLGGIGKSQLAIEYAKRHQDDYTAIFWLNAKTEDTLKGSFVEGARRLPKRYFNQALLQGSQNEETLADILQEMKVWFDLPGNYRWLMIFDNVDNPKIPDNKDAHAYDIRSYFPKNYRGSILVTTRWKTLAIGRPLNVAKLSTAEDSISLLVQKSERPLEEDPGIGDLLKKLDGLPLALATAGGFLGMTGIPVSEYLHDYEASWLELQETSPELLSYEKKICSTWDLSYNHIRKEDESAAKLLELWAYFDNQDLWYDLLKAGEGEWAPDWFRQIVGTKHAFRKAVVKLQKHALVELSEDFLGYSMHHCVHAWVKTVLSKTIEDRNMELALACVAGTVPIEIARDDWIMEQRVLPHSERLLELLSDWDQEGSYTEVGEVFMAKFFHSVGKLYRDQDRLTKAESLLLRASNSYKRVYGPDFEGKPEIIHSLAILYEEQGRLTEAESMYVRAMTRYETALGPDDESTLCVVNNLAGLYSDQGKHAKAEMMYQRVFTAHRKTLGSDYGSVTEMYSRGSFYIDQGKLREAEPLCQLALVIYEETLGEDHRHTLNAVNNLGRLYKCQGRLTEAESMYQRALTSYERTLRRGHVSALHTTICLGVVYRDQGKLTEAESMYQRALMGYERILGPDHKSTLDAVYNLGLLHYQQSKLAEAESMYQRALTGYEKSLGPDHESTLNAVGSFGNLYMQQGKLKEAESMYQRELKGKEKAFEQDHLSTLRANNNMGALYLNQGKLKEAESMFLRALVGYSRNPPSDTKEKLLLFYNIGGLYQLMQDFEKAKEFFSQAYEGRRELLGSQHDDTIKFLNALREVEEEIEREKYDHGSTNKAD